MPLTLANDGLYITKQKVSARRNTVNSSKFVICLAKFYQILTLVWKLFRRKHWNVFSAYSASAVFLLSINIVKAGGHLPHEIAPAAKSGQSTIIYRMPCSAKGQADALTTLSVMADHEHQNSPVEYKTVQVKFENGDIGAVDVHSSMSNFEKASAWMDSDKRWQDLFSSILASCETSLEAMEIRVLSVQ